MKLSIENTVDNLISDYRKEKMERSELHAALTALGESGIRVILNRIASSTDKDREFLTQALSFYPAEAIPLIAQEYQSHASEHARLAAVEALGRMKSPAAGARLVSALGDRSRAVQQAAHNGILAMDESDSLPVIVGSLGHSNPKVNSWLRRLLQSYDHEDVAPLLFNALMGEMYSAREAAEELLPEYTKGEQLAGRLSELMFMGDNPETRRRAASVYKKVDPEGMRTVLLGQLELADMLPRMRALDALAVLRDTGHRTMSQIADLFKEENQSIREKAISTLEVYGDECLNVLASKLGEVTPLSPQLEIEKFNVVDSVIDTLGKIGTEKSLRFLVGILDQDKTTASHAAVAISDKYENRAIPYLEDYLYLPGIRPEFGKRVIDLLGGLGGKEAMAALVRAMDAEVDSIVEYEELELPAYATHVLYEIGDNALPYLHEALKSGTTFQRLGAMKALIKRAELRMPEGDEKEEEHLREIFQLAAGGSSIALHALACTERFAIPFYEKVLESKDSSPGERAAAVKLLGGEMKRVLMPACMYHLAIALGDEDDMVSDAAYEAMKELAPNCMQALVLNAGETNSKGRDRIATLAQGLSSDPKAQDFVIAQMISTDGNKDPWCRALSKEILFSLGREYPENITLLALKGDDNEREAYSETVVRLSSDSIPVLIEALLKEKDSLYQKRAVELLSRIGDPAVDALKELLDENRGRRFEVRSKIITMLREINSEKSRTVLLSLMGSSPADTELVSMELPLLGESVLPGLNSILKSDNNIYDKRVTAAMAIAEMNCSDNEKMKSLSPLLADKNDEVRRAAMKGLLTLEEERHSGAVIVYLSANARRISKEGLSKAKAKGELTESQRIMRSIGPLFVNMGSDAALDRLNSFCSPPEMRGEIISGLVQYFDDVEHNLRSLAYGEKRKYLQMAALQALARKGEKDAVQPLLDALDSSDDKIESTATQCLLDMDSDTVVGAIAMESFTRENVKSVNYSPENVSKVLRVAMEQKRRELEKKKKGEALPPRSNIFGAFIREHMNIFPALTHLAMEGDRDLRRASLLILSKSKHLHTIPTLISALGSADDLSVELATDGLLLIEDKGEVVDALVSSVIEEKNIKQCFAVLGKMEGKEAMDGLTSLLPYSYSKEPALALLMKSAKIYELAKEDASVNEALFYCAYQSGDHDLMLNSTIVLSELADPKAIPLWVHKLRSEDANEMGLAKDSLLSLEEKGLVVEALVKEMKKGRIVDRGFEILSKLKGPEPIEGLLDLLGAEASVSGRARMLLVSRGRETVSLALKRYAEEKEERHGIASVLRAMGEPAKEMLADAFYNSDETAMRLTALGAEAEAFGMDADGELRLAFNDNSPVVMNKAAELVLRLGTKAFEIARTVAKDPHSLDSAVELAIQVIGQMDHELAEPLLQRYLESGSPLHMQSALETFASYRKDGSSFIVSYAEDKDWAMKERAANAALMAPTALGFALRKVVEERDIELLPDLLERHESTTLLKWAVFSAFMKNPIAWEHAGDVAAPTSQAMLAAEIYTELNTRGFWAGGEFGGSVVDYLAEKHSSTEEARAHTKLDVILRSEVEERKLGFKLATATLKKIRERKKAEAKTKKEPKEEGAATIKA